MVTQNGCATISDSETGELLFYSNGRNIWNREHELMPNGQDFRTDCWSGITQSALIVPFPGDESKYYLFSIYYTEQSEGSIFIEQNCQWGQNSTEHFREIRYSVIDMSLDGGLGDVALGQKHIRLQLNSTEKLTAVPHSNGNDYWIISHGFNNNDFFVYLLTDAGISMPTVTSIGSIHRFQPNEFFADDEARGYLKASPDGHKLACAVASGKRPFDLFDFDPETGKISNYVNLGLVGGQYGVSFSPDNSKLYVTSDDRPEPSVYPYPDIIIQYDLGAGDDQAVVASRKSILRDNTSTNIPGHGIFEGFLLLEKGMQLALDGKLYITGDYAYMPTDPTIMVVISRPNETGTLCQANYRKFDFVNGAVGTGLPNFIDSYFNGLESIGECLDGLSVSVFPNPTTGIVNIYSLTGCTTPTNIVVYNSLGQQVATFASNESHASIDASAWASGMYIFVLTTTYGQRIVHKILKV
jgi:hypothetical protein